MTISDREPHLAVAAVLAMTAAPPDGLVPVEYDECGNPLTGAPVEQVVAKQVIALLREHADWLQSRLGLTSRAVSATWRRIDEIEAQYRTTEATDA